MNVSMRNMFKPSTNTPEFFRTEERDIVLPQQGKLTFHLKDYESIQYNETTIGSTIIDLEDRWHSYLWNYLSDRDRTPRENRGLWTLDSPGSSCGSIEMWIEMLES